MGKMGGSSNDREKNEIGSSFTYKRMRMVGEKERMK